MAGRAPRAAFPVPALRRGALSGQVLAAARLVHRRRARGDRRGRCAADAASASRWAARSRCGRGRAVGRRRARLAPWLPERLSLAGLRGKRSGSCTANSTGRYRACRASRRAARAPGSNAHSRSAPRVSTHCCRAACTESHSVRHGTLLPCPALRAGSGSAPAKSLASPADADGSSQSCANFAPVQIRTLSARASDGYEDASRPHQIGAAHESSLSSPRHRAPVAGRRRAGGGRRIARSRRQPGVRRRRERRRDVRERLRRAQPGPAGVDLSGWTIQYASAASSSWSATALSGSIAPGRSYLVQLASTAAVECCAADARCDRNNKPRLRAARWHSSRTQPRSRVAQLPAAARPRPRSATSSVTAAPPTTKEAARRRRSPSDCRPARRVRVHRYRRQRLRLRLRHARAAHSASPAVTCAAVRRRAAAPPRSAGRCRRAVPALDRPRAFESQLRPGPHRDGAAAALRGHHCHRQRRCRLLLDVHRSAFTPADLPLWHRDDRPGSGQVGPGLAGGARAAIRSRPLPTW